MGREEQIAYCRSHCRSDGNIYCADCIWGSGCPERPPEGCWEFCWRYQRADEEVCADKYLVVFPSGELRWEMIPSHGRARLERMYEIIGCSCVEQVRTVFGDICLVIDESGKIKSVPHEHNELASRLYYGYHSGLDDIVGPAILCGLSTVGPYHELDLVPLDGRQLSLLSLAFGKEIEM